MKRKPLSERNDFAPAVILSAEWSSNPGANGVCELGIRLKRNRTEFWNWARDWGDPYAMCECASVIDRKTEWRDWIREIASNELFASTVDSLNTTWKGVNDEIGELISYAWCADEDVREATWLLTKLDDESIKGLSRNWPSAIVFAKSICTQMRQEDIWVDDLPELIGLKKPTASGMERAVDEIVKELVSRR